MIDKLMVLTENVGIAKELESINFKKQNKLNLKLGLFF